MTIIKCPICSQDICVPDIGPRAEHQCSPTSLAAYHANLQMQAQMNAFRYQAQPLHGPTGIIGYNGSMSSTMRCL